MIAVYKITQNDRKNNIQLVDHTEFSDKDLRWHTTFLKVAEIMGANSHCVSHKVGAVLVKNKRIISTGINGTPAGHVNCDEVFNPESFGRTTHHEWSGLNELHAEVNAIAIAAKEGISTKDSILYTTISPCVHCSKVIIASGIKQVVFSELYDLDNYGLILMLQNNIDLYLIKKGDINA